MIIKTVPLDKLPRPLSHMERRQMIGVREAFVALANSIWALKPFFDGNIETIPDPRCSDDELRLYQHFLHLPRSAESFVASLAVLHALGEMEDEQRVRSGSASYSRELEHIKRGDEEHDLASVTFYESPFPDAEEIVQKEGADYTARVEAEVERRVAASLETSTAAAVANELAAMERVRGQLEREAAVRRKRNRKVAKKGKARR